MKSRAFAKACAAVLAAVLSLPHAAQSADSALLGTEWTLKVLQGVAVDSGATIKFEADKVTGTSGCNSYWAAIDYGDAKALDIGPPQSVRVYCPGRSKMERAFFAALETITTFDADGKSLKLNLDDGDVFLEFAK
jgi:heat shock protein HslJ